jgi:hypothetical protein
LSALGDVLAYHTDGLEPGIADRVRVLIAALSPERVADRVRLLVTEMPWDHPCDEQLGFAERTRRQEEIVDQLVVELLEDPKALPTFFPELSVGNQRMSHVFGRSLAMRAPDPLVWLEPIMAAIEAAPSNNRNFGLLAGYFSGLAVLNEDAVESFKQMATESSIFAPALPVLCWLMNIKQSDIALICKALSAGLIPPYMMSQWNFGGVLAKLPPAAVAPLFDQMLRMDERAYSVGLVLMGMYVHGHYERLDELRPQLRLAAQSANRRKQRGGSQMDAHHFKEMMGWILSKGRDDPDASAIVIILTKQVIGETSYAHDTLVKPLMPGLLAKFPELVWPLLGQAIVADRKTSWRVEHLLGDSLSFGDAQNPPILHFPRDMLFAWCHAHPHVGPAFLAGIFPVLTSRNPTAPNRDFHPATRRLLDEFGDREDVLRGLTRNMHTFGWSGSRTTYYALYDQPLRGLDSHPIPQVRRWARKMLGALQQKIEAVSEQEDEDKAHWRL